MGTLAGTTSKLLRMTSWDCKKTKVLLRKACDWIPVNSKDIQRPAHPPWKTMENCASSVWIHWSCYGAVAPGLSISSACWIMLQQLHLLSLYTCHMYVYTYPLFFCNVKVLHAWMRSESAKMTNSNWEQSCSLVLRCKNSILWLDTSVLWLRGYPMPKENLEMWW